MTSLRARPFKATNGYFITFILWLLSCRTLLGHILHPETCEGQFRELANQPEVLVLVHPQHRTDAILDSPQMKQIPRIVLPASNLLNQARYRKGDLTVAPDVAALAPRATVLILKEDRGIIDPSVLPSPLSATTIHLGGGHSHACLANTVAQLPALLKGNSRRLFIIHLDATWGETDSAAPYKRLDAISDTEMQTVLNGHLKQVKSSGEHLVEVQNLESQRYRGPGTVRASYIIRPAKGERAEVEVVLVSGTGPQPRR